MLHVVGSSLFMFYLIVHYIRGYYRIQSLNYGYCKYSYLIGIIILLSSLINGYIGYTLNWGQMSFWGITVIGSIIISIPIVGRYFAYILLPSYSIITNRLFSFHYLLGLIISLLIVIHIIMLHTFSSSSPIINSSSSNIIPFIIYTINKDILLLINFTYLLFYFLIYDHDILGNCDNNITANPFQTPNNILPEWYYLLYYCCLRSHSNKNNGVLIVFS